MSVPRTGGSLGPAERSTAASAGATIRFVFRRTYRASSDESPSYSFDTRRPPPSMLDSGRTCRAVHPSLAAGCFGRRSSPLLRCSLPTTTFDCRRTCRAVPPSLAAGCFFSRMSRVHPMRRAVRDLTASVTATDSFAGIAGVEALGWGLSRLRASAHWTAPSAEFGAALDSLVTVHARVARGRRERAPQPRRGRVRGEGIRTGASRASPMTFSLWIVGTTSARAAANGGGHPRARRRTRGRVALALGRHLSCDALSTITIDSRRTRRAIHPMRRAFVVRRRRSGPPTPS